MEEEFLLKALEDIAERFSIKVEYENLKNGEVDSKGGLFTLRGKRRILLHKGLSLNEKIGILTEIVALQDIERIHIPFKIRKFLEGRKVS